MKRTYTINEIVGFYTSLKAVLDCKDIDLDVATKFAILKNIKSCESHYQNFETVKNEIVIKYAVKDKDGKPIMDENNAVTISTDEDTQKALNADLGKLLSQSIEIDLDNLQADEVLKASISANQMMALYSLLEAPKQNTEGEE